MGREDLIFTKRTMVIVAALSTLGSWAAGTFLAGWTARDAQDKILQKTTAAATAAAVAAVQVSVEPLKIELAQHKGADETWHQGEADRLKRIEDDLRAGRVSRP